MGLTLTTAPRPVQFGGTTIALQRPRITLGLAWYAGWCQALTGGDIDTTEAEIELGFALADLCLANRAEAPWGDEHAKDYPSRGRAVLEWCERVGASPAACHETVREIRLALLAWVAPPSTFPAPPPAPPSSADSAPPVGGSGPAAETGGGS